MKYNCVILTIDETCPRTPAGVPLMLQEVLFAPALTWCMQAWMAQGAERFFVICPEADLAQVEAAFPAGAVAAAGSADAANAFAEGYDTLSLKGSFFPVGGELKPVATVQELLALQPAAAEEIAARHLAAGVSILSPATCCIDPRVTIAPGTVILPGTILQGNTAIGSGCRIGPNSLIADSVIGDGTEVNASQVYSSTTGKDVPVGPYAHVRPKCQIGDKCKVGAFVEIKNARFGTGTKMAHLTSVGDAEVGSKVNFGCGTITSNYDGFTKSKAIIGDNVFVGCNTNLVSPVTVGDGAYIAAGTTVTRNVEPDALAIGRVRQEQKAGWAKKRRDMHKK